MKKIITITDPMQVRAGDKAYFKGCDFGFTVLSVDGMDKRAPIMVNNPLSDWYYWPHLNRFDYATREVEEPEWPNPHDIELHVYLGADGKRYIYNPCSKKDTGPWAVECSIGFRNRQLMALTFPEALPLTELKLVPAKDDDDEQ